jgi:hypothetical protein
MKEDAILKVTKALRDRLQAALTAASLPPSVFVGPLDDAQAGGASLVLFLYRIVPNPNLRNSERRIASAQPPRVDTFRNSLPLDLHFLLTVGSDSESSEERGLHKLGAALQAMQLDPDLTGATVEYETCRVTLEPLTTEEASKIWSLFPGANYRTSVAFVASPVWIDPPTPIVLASPVAADRLVAGRKVAEVGV